MTLINIQLTGNHFRTLVSGGEVSFDESDIARSLGITLEPGIEDKIAIILEDIGWEEMVSIIELARVDQAIVRKS